MIGVGAFGRNHARVYHELARGGEPVELAAIVDADLARAQAVAREFGARAYASLQELKSAGSLQGLVASLAVPTVQHLAVAAELMEAGADVLIEKPLAASLAEADELIRMARCAGRIAQAGHLERFNPAVRATLALITRPMFFEVHRLSVFTPRSLDIDVVLDLMIHDLDVVLSLVNSPVKEIRAVGIPILSPRADIANVRVEFDSGCVANFTASRVSTERVRKLRFFQPRQYISVDYSRQDVLVFTLDPAAQGKSLSRDAIQVTRPPVQPEEPLHAELKAFLEAARRRSPPLVSLEDARRALALALDINAAIAEHRRKAKLDVSSEQ